MADGDRSSGPGPARRRAARGLPAGGLAVRRRREVAAALVALFMIWVVLSQAPVGSFFSGVTGTPVNSLTAITLDPFIPGSVTASRTGPTSCAVSWTVSAASGPPGGLTYDVTNGSGTTLSSAVSGLSTTVIVGSAAVTPTVKARVGSWVSAAARTSAAACVAVPDAPTGLSLVAGDTTLTASWTAASGNGSAVTGYTVTATPGGATCSTTSATTCMLTGLTNGVSYAVTVTATNVNGTGPASSPAVNGTPISSRPLDAVSASSTAAYSVRRLRAGYAGYALQVRRASDSTTSDIGFGGTGDLDTATLTSFCAATSCYLRTWYDQSGNSGRDLTQTTAAYQPRIVNAGVVDLSDGRPTVVFSGSQQLITGSSAVPFGGATLTGNAVAYSSSSSGYSGRFLAFTDSGQVNDWDNATSATALSRRNAGYVGSKRNGTLITATTADDTLALFTAVFDGTNDTLYLGSSSAASTSTSGSFASTGALSVGAQKDYTDSNARLAGAVSEITAFGSALGSTDRSALATSQTSYYLLPNAPTSVTATPGDATATISWTAPTVSGASAITSYTATASPGGQACSTGSTSCTITGLTDGTVYTVSVAATNGTGTGTTSSSTTVIPYPGLLTTSNAQLWLDGYDVDGDATIEGAAENCATGTSCTSASNVLTRWVDKSGRGHDAVQATTAMAGTYAPGTHTVSFSANGYYQAASVGVGPDASSFVVAKSGVTPFNTYGWLLGTRSANGWMIHPQSGATSVRYLGIKGDTFNNQAVATATVTPVTAITNTHLWDGEISGTTSVSGDLATDGALGTATTATLSGGAVRAAASVTATIGADDLDLTNRRGNGTFDELVGFNRTLSATERRTVQEYLARKWSVSITAQAPTGLTLTAGDTTATAAWTAPAWNGGSTVTGYTATAVPSDGTLPTVTCTTSATGCTLTGLTNGITYTTSLTATNSLGNGPASASASVIPYPSGVMTSGAVKLWLDGADSSTLLASSACTGAVASSTVGCWKDKSTSTNNATQATGGNQPTLATVAGRSVPGFNGSSSYLALSPSLLPTGTTSGTTLAVATLTDPTPGSSGVRSVFNYGTLSGGQARQLQKLASASTMAVSTGTNATQGNWAASPTLLAAEFTSSTESIWTAGQAASTVTGLTNNTGTTYADVGSSGTPAQFWYGQIPEIISFTGTLTSAQRRQVEEYLARKWSITITPAAPGTPTATATDAQAAISWTAPSWNGGASVTGYTVTASPGGATCSTATTSCTVTGLTNGTAYTFTVTATNTAGVGPASAASNAATPPGPPGTPTAVAASPGDTTAAISWTAPGTGTPYTSYTATAVPSDGTLATRTCTSATSPCTITGMTDGGTYTVSVTATNAAGTGSASATVTAIPYPAVLTGANSKLWLDGADSTTVFQDTAATTATTTAGQSVAAWKDKSGQHNDVTAPGSAPTADTTTFGSNLSVTFSAGHYLSRGSGFPTSSDYSTFAVYRTTNASCTNNILSGSVNTGHAFYLQASAGLSVWHNATQVGANAGNTVNVSYLGTGTFTNSGLGASVEVDGAPTVSGTVGYATTDAGIQVGAFAGSNGFCGQIAEVGALNKVLSSTERRTVDEYLSRKWSVTITPAAPGSATATAGNAQAVVSWTAPSWNGGSAITSYTATASPGGNSCTIAYPTTTCTVTGLTNGTAYTFGVAATNSVGTGPTTSSSSVTPLTTPGAPTGVAATAADTTSSVSWTAPASNGGSAITSYTATAVPTDGTLSTITCSAASSPCTLTGLTNGAPYSVTVTATSAVGTGAASSPVTLVTYPTTLFAQANLGGWWDANYAAGFLNTSGTSATSGQSVKTWNDRSGNGITVTQNTGANQGTATSLNGLTAWASTNSTYLTSSATGNFRTVLSAGRLASGPPVWSTTFAAPANTDFSQRLFHGLMPTAGSPSANSNDWGYTGSGWSNTVLNSGGSTTATNIWESEAPSTQNAKTVSISSSYSTRGFSGTLGEVAAFNRVLSSAERRVAEEYLARKWAVTITPAAPTSVTGSAATSSVTVSWTAPSWNGGAAISSYTATASPGGQTCTASYPTTSCTVTGLTAGTSYTFTVTATNSVGAGPASAASGSVTPIDVPAAPTLSSAAAGDGQVALTWTTPANHGAAITGYTIAYSWTSGQGASGNTSTTVGVTTTTTISSLTNGYTYTFTVAATNSVGTGPASAALSATAYPATVMSAANLSLWLDAADTSTLFQDTAAATPATTSGQGVGRWNDKSGQTDGSGINYASQATAGNRPTLSSVAGKLVPTFDGSSQLLALRTVALLPTGSSSSTLVVVAASSDPTPGSSSYRTVFEYGQASNGKSREIYKPNSSNAVAADTWQKDIATDSTWSTSPRVAVAQFASSQVQLWAHGRPYVTGTGTAIATGSSFGDVGSENGNYYWMGTIPEVIEFDTTLTTTQRRQVEEYLAQKWGATITPGTPTGATGSVASTTSVTVSWTAPSWNGGASISSYTVTASPGGQTCSTASTSCTVTGLTHNTAYTFTVTATNSVGTGPASNASSSVTP